MFPVTNGCPRPAGTDGRAPDVPPWCVLSEMRNRQGGPNWRMRALAVLLCLLLAGPLTLLILQGAARVLGLAL